MKNLAFGVSFGIGLLLLINTSQWLFGQTKKSLTAEQIEQLRALDELQGSLDRLKVAGDALIKEKFYDCVKSFDYPFCECLRDNLPVGVGFQTYVRIITANKQDLNYAQLNPEDKKMVDVTYQAREKCVRQLPSFR